MMISIIAAIGKNRELGKDNKLLWHIPEDLKHFKEITSGHPVIMGRKTFDSIGRVLPNRLNIVITRNPVFETLVYKKAKGQLIAVNSLEKAVGEAKRHGEKDEIFIIGGGQIFKQAIGIADKLYLTVIDKEFDADSFFPDYSMFTKKVFEKEGESGEYKYKFLELERD